MKARNKFYIEIIESQLVFNYFNKYFQCVQNNFRCQRFVLYINYLQAMRMYVVHIPDHIFALTTLRNIF